MCPTGPHPLGFVQGGQAIVDRDNHVVRPAVLNPGPRTPHARRLPLASAVSHRAPLPSHTECYLEPNLNRADF